VRWADELRNQFKSIRTIRKEALEKGMEITTLKWNFIHQKGTAGLFLSNFWN
jgi:hypothetical protein